LRPAGLRTAAVDGHSPGSRYDYLAYSTARVSRMTVTLIWPG
jgi:hypothetical protein